ncbi:MAG: protoporphyrinogen oxidase [Bacteroidales bacterium]|nr:protoporphyrinogen oxidase [Bacteroidales bacterium]MBS3774197.1 protoporphyrinogen oxidase [Bacteroidales bacterium]
MNAHYDIVILGAGLTGLTMAHKLKDSDQSVLVLEKNDRPGGVIGTQRENGFIYEEGPNTGIVKYGEVAELFDELNDYCKPFIPDESVKKRYIWKNDRWEKLPSGLKEGIKTPLFSRKDKFRILGEPFRKPGRNPEETLDAMVRRRMGETFLHYAVDPFILGVYAGDPSMIVPKYALPKLYYLEQDYGSFIGGAVKKKFEKKDEMEKKATKNVFSVKGGLSNLTTALYKSAGKDRFLFNIEGLKVKPESNHFEVEFQHQGKNGKIKANRVISTVGAYELPSIFPFLDKGDINDITNLKYAKVVQAAVGFKNWQGPQLDGFGGLVPHIEKRDILGALFMSSFLPDRAPDGGQLFAIFMGGIRREELYEKSDQQLTGLLEKEMKHMFGLNQFQPDLLRFHRYQYAIPQYGKESSKRFKSIKKIENQHKGLIIAGNLKGGIGMADRIKQAADIAEMLHNQL